LHDVAGTNDAVYCQALGAWLNSLHSTEVPLSVRQMAWDEPLMRLRAEGVLFAAQSQARLIAVTAPHAGDFLTVIPCSSLA